MPFKNHELSACHREGVEVIIRLPATTTHIGVHLSQQYALEMEQNKRMLLKVLFQSGSCLERDWLLEDMMMTVMGI